MRLEEDHVAGVQEEPLTVDRFLGSQDSVSEARGPRLDYETDPESAEGFVKAARLGEPFPHAPVPAQERWVDGEVIADRFRVPRLVDEGEMEGAGSDQFLYDQVSDRLENGLVVATAVVER